MGKRTLSFILALVMVIGMIPANLVNANTNDLNARDEKRIEVKDLGNGVYLLREPGVDYDQPRQAIVKRQPKEEDLEEDWVSVGIAKMLMDALKIEEVTLQVRSRELDLENKPEYNHVFKRNPSPGENKIGDWAKVKVPKRQFGRFIYVIFPDGRDSRAVVEAKSLPTGLAVNIDFRGHTGVRTEWYGKSTPPSVKAEYEAVNQECFEFDLPTVNQNTILRKDTTDWEWKDHNDIKYIRLVPENDITLNEVVTAMELKVLVNRKEQGKLTNGSNYYFKMSGNGLEGFKMTMREKYNVDFNAGDGKWKTSQPAQQFSAHGLKLKETFMDAPDTIGPVTVPNGTNDLTPPAAEAGKPAKKFAGWSTTKNGPAVDMATYVVAGDVTFYALYAEEEQGKVKVEYKDSKTNAAIESKYQLKGQEYPAEKTGDMDKAIKDEVFDTNKAPKFLGYKIKSITTDPVPNPPATANYTKNGDYTVIYTYDKLDDIIPEKKNGQDNPDVTPDVKEHYAKVTFKVAAADDAKAKLQLDGADATSPLVYYVNPLEGKKIAEVANVKAVSKDDNLYYVDENDMWTFDPDSISGINQVISQATDGDGNVVKTEITLTAKVADKTAAKFKDKLDPQDIKVWKGDDIDWKNGVKIKDSEKDKANLEKTLKEELAKDKAKVEDLGENGTIAEPKDERKSDAQNLPDGKKGNLKITFDDGSTLVVNGQTLYVADQKVEEKDPKDKDYINPDLLPKDKVKVEIKLGEGVKEAKEGGKEGNAANPVLVKTFYVKPNTGLAETDFPKIVKLANYKDPIKWNPSDKTQTWNKDGSYTASADSAVCKTPQALQQEFEAAIDPMFENIKKKDGVYLGKYDKANKKVTVAIIDKTKSFSELKGTGLVAGLKDLLKNHNLIKYQVGNQPARDLKAIEKASGTEQELVNNLAQIVAADMGNEINGQGNNIKTLADFIDKKITLKLTVQEPDCEANKVELTYTIEGKEAISSILKGKLSPQDIKVWKGDVIDWEMGVKKDETGLTAEQINQIKDEFTTVENGEKKVGKAKFEDATTPARDSKAASVNPFIGNIKVTFSDGSELLVEKQNLYVSELMTGKNNENAPDDAIEVKFLLGKGVKATKGATEIKGAETPVVYETYKVKPKLNLDEYKLGTNKTIFDSINAESMDKVKYSDIVWTPADHVVTKTNKEFTANATEAFIMKHEFKLLDKDNNNAEITVLPQVLKDKLPADKTVAKGKTYTPENLAPIKEVKDGENFYDYTFVKWEPTSAKDKDQTFVGTWTREQSKSAKPQIKTPIEGDKVIEGKGKPGSDIEVTIPGVKDPIHTTVENDGKWKVVVPKDKELKSGEKIVAKQTEKGKKPSESTAIVETDKPSCMTPAPEINPVYDSDEYITGRGIPGAVIEVRYRDYPILRTKVDNFGEWEVYTPYPLEDEQFVYARQIKEPCDPSVWVSEEIRYDYEYWRKDDKKEEPKKPVEIKKVWTPAELNARDHFSYIKGYGDNTFGPNRTITRAEVAMIFARLSINQSVSGAPQFKDVKAGDWYKTAVDIVARQGVVKGYEDGTFRPNQPITRRVFAAIAARYAGNIDTWRTFRDVPSTDWAYTLINRVGGAGWITGYEDNTFRPNNNITRAEVVAIVNRMLNRKADKAYVDNNLMRSKHSFIDNLRSAWYFYDIHEAAVGHSFERQPNGVDEKWNRVNGQAFEIRER